MNPTIALPGHSAPELENLRIATAIGPLQVLRIGYGGDLTEVSKLRYEVYIREQGKSYSEADHHHRVFTDSLDYDGITLMVRRGGGCVGTVRINHFDDRLADAKYGFFLNSAPFVKRWGPRSITTCTRLAVSASDRRGEICRRLFDEIYLHGQRLGVRICLIYCKKDLQPMFLHYGFQTYLPDTHDPVAGPVARMLLILENLDHYKSIRSPFARHVLAPSLGAETAAWFARREGRGAKRKQAEAVG